MNVTTYTTLIDKPTTITELQTVALEKVLEEFPFFQSARAMRLKGLYNQNSFKYNFALKVTAAHTADRAVLFDFITSDNFVGIQKELYDKKALELLDINIIGSEIIATKERLESKENTIEQSILSSIKVSSPAESVTHLLETEEKLNMGTPLDFSKKEKHSFQEWLQLSRNQPINRESQNMNNVPELQSEGQKKKAAIIDKFIETSPKISPVKHGVASTIRIDINKEDQSSLMTETLARVYLEQKKYQKAIQAYEILILKYPEKSSFFADRIADIKILQHNNN